MVPGQIVGRCTMKPWCLTSCYSCLAIALLAIPPTILAGEGHEPSGASRPGRDATASGSAATSGGKGAGKTSGEKGGNAPSPSADTKSPAERFAGRLHKDGDW